jgi:predicted ferric reductase
MNKTGKYAVYGLFVINLIIILVGWRLGSQRAFAWDAAKLTLILGRLFGLLAVFFVLVQFILIGREIWIEKLFGLDRLARVHRLNGYLSISFILLHFIFLIVSYALQQQVGLGQQFMDFWNNWQDANQAFLGLLVFLLVVVSSITIARKRYKYEAWYFVHLLTYLAVLLAWGHQLKLGGDFSLKNQWFVYYWYVLYGFVIINYLAFRIFRPLWNYARFGFVIDEVVQETEDSWSVYIKAQKGDIGKFGIEPGQFMSVRFLGKGVWWQSHPFSLSFVPKNNSLRITVKKLGDFTANIPNLKKGTPVLVEGPFGLFKAQPGINNKYAFIAGGVGITPIRALVEQVAPQNDLIVFYCNRSMKDIILKKEMEELAAQHNFRLVQVLSDTPVEGCEQGRLDKEKLQRLSPDIKDRQVYMCGPGPMMAGLQKMLMEDFGLNIKQIHFDIFSLS